MNGRVNRLGTKATEESPPATSVVRNRPFAGAAFGHSAPLKVNRIQASRRPLRSSESVVGVRSRPVSAEIAAVKTAWAKYQSSRHRRAVYIYLAAVYEVVGRWERSGNLLPKLRQALDLLPRPVSMRVGEAFAVAIYCTSDPAIVDPKTRSKWSRVLRVAQHHEIPPDRVEKFIRRRGGVNACNSRPK